jgi:hypothetical protein
MGQRLTAKGIRSRISKTRNTAPSFFYEIWHNFADVRRMNIEVSRRYPSAAEARAACDGAIPLYLAKQRSQRHARKLDVVTILVQLPISHFVPIIAPPAAGTRRPGPVPSPASLPPPACPP